MRPASVFVIVLILAGAPLAFGRDRGAWWHDATRAPGPIPSPKQETHEAEQREFLIKYRKVVNDTNGFVRTWEKWCQTRARLAESKVLDYKLFKKEAKLWKQVVERIEKLDRERPGDGYIESKPKQ